MKGDSSENTTLQVSGGSDDVVLTKPVVISETGLEARAVALGVPLLSVAPKEIPKSVLSFLSEESAKRYKMAAISREGKKVLVAMVDPEDTEALNVLRFLSEKEHVEIEIALLSDKILQNVFDQYRGNAALNEAILSLGNEDSEISLSGDLKGTDSDTGTQVLQDAPIARLVESIVQHAIDARASDIHIEPTEEGYRIRFRVDGLLHSSLVFPLQIGKAVVARIKILSNLKIDEKRKPQDGRFRAEQDGLATDLRVSTFPVIDGEKVVMRILDKDQNIVDFAKMGLWGRNGEILRKEIMQPYGIILMTGPTGSGKSTTLYSFLQILNQEERNIVTLEDPVEFSIPGVNQSQVKPEIGYTFANGLRSILRQDPNVIMVGEIRDGETAELAIHSALTGHLVISTLHTNSAIGSIPRLVDMGIEPFLLASSLRVVAAQRLVRRICSECKEEEKLSARMMQSITEGIASVPAEEIAKYGYDPKAGLHLFRGKGCEKCGNTGFKGRIAICEALEVTEDVKQIITDQRASEVKLNEEARRQGMISMRQDGILKALCGMSTITEIERVTEGGIMVDEE
ncbi:MAG: GspE/PulE family protein [Candidatus Moraniibacteriota bacterium]